MNWLSVTTHSAPSMSKSALLLSPCIAWAGPMAQWYNEDQVEAQDTQKRDDGTTFHKWIDWYSKTGGVVLNHPRDINIWLEHATKYLDEVLLPRAVSIRTEVAVSANWVTGEAVLLPHVKDRKYPDRPGWQNGTADIVLSMKDGSLLVGDWKTGGTDGAEEQLLSLACAIQRANHEYKTVRTLCLQVNEHGVWPHETEVSAEALQAHWDAMAFQWEDCVKMAEGQDIGKRNDPKPGIHCTALYCPHLAYCKAIGAHVGALAMAGNNDEPLIAPESLTRFRVTDKPVSDEEAGYTQAMVSAANRQIKYLTTANKDRVKNGGKVVSGQYTWSDGGNGYRWKKSK